MIPEINLMAAKRLVTSAGCWEWTGATNGYRYGMLFVHGRRYYAHRLSYQLAAETIPARYVVDHLCENTLCFNPEHLEAVTHQENIRRASKVGAKTHCVHGHAYTPENTYVTPAGARQCRNCNKRRSQITNARRRREAKR